MRGRFRGGGNAPGNIFIVKNRKNSLNELRKRTILQNRYRATPFSHFFQRADTHEYPIKGLHLNHRTGMVTLKCLHHRGKIYRALPDGAVGIPSAVIIVDMHMGKPGLQELRQAVIDMCMAGIEGKNRILQCGRDQKECEG